MLNRIKKVEKIYDKYKLKCEELKEYSGKMNELIKIISNYKLTDNRLSLMNYIYPNNDILNIETFLFLAEKWEILSFGLNQDYTEIFSKIITSSDFKELYLSALKSSYVINFVKDFDLKNSYETFIEKYAENIDKYILYVPLTRGIKAHVANYFRIALNINSVELVGNIEQEKDRNSIYTSYLLVQLLYESFHFIYILEKKNSSCHNTLSPERTKIKQSYREIGVDLILHLFGTEYITYFPLSCCELLNSQDSWKHEGTKFHVFNKTYLIGDRLETEKNEKETRIGLKCNITLYEEYNNDFNDSKICTSA